jgi:hypothetical protein
MGDIAKKLVIGALAALLIGATVDLAQGEPRRGAVETVVAAESDGAGGGGEILR